MGIERSYYLYIEVKVAVKTALPIHITVCAVNIDILIDGIINEFDIIRTIVIVSRWTAAVSKNNTCSEYVYAVIIHDFDAVTAQTQIV